MLIFLVDGLNPHLASVLLILSNVKVQDMIVDHAARLIVGHFAVQLDEAALSSFHVRLPL